RKWGNRPSVDNWRRAGSSTGSAQQGNNLAGSSTDNQSATDDLKGLPTEEALLAFIPKTPEARATATSRLQRAYVDLASSYVRNLEDYTRGSAVLDTLNKRWTTTPYAAEAMYLRYLIALRRNNLQEAQNWSSKLQKDYPESSWAAQVAPPADQSEEQ